MGLLTEAEYKATMGTPMTLLAPEDEFRPMRLSDYVSAIPDQDLQGRDFSLLEIQSVYREPRNQFIHVLLTASTPNVFLVVVVDEPDHSVHGHYLLDLNREYGRS